MRATSCRLHTTKRLLREHEACTEGYKKLMAHLGGASKVKMDEPIPLLTVLDSNGLDDALWCLRATIEDAESEIRLLACDFAERALPIFGKKQPNDDRPRKAIEVARRFARGEATDEERAAAWDAARAAARAAVWDAARAAARAAVWAAAWDAARDAAWAAAGDAARDAAWAAAWAAARDAARAAAGDAARDAAWAAARAAERNHQERHFRAWLTVPVKEPVS